MNEGYAYYNDNNKFCCDVLRKNVERGLLPGGKIDERDIREVHARDFVGYQHIHLFAGIGAFSLGMQWANYTSSIRTITAGFPCQDISNAGRREGITGERSGLWKEAYRLIQETLDLHMGPDIILLENVAALINRGLSTVLGDLAEAGFNAEWRVLSAADFGAPHIRERVFIVAYPEGRENRGIFQPRLQTHFIADCPALANTQSPERERPRLTRAGEPRSANSGADLAHASISGRQECNMPGVASGQRHLTRCDVAHSAACRLEEQQEPGWTHDQFNTPCEGQSQSRLGRELDGFSSRLDRPIRWPAGSGEPQHNWEPPRVVIGKQPDRAKRLKALGNAIVPQCVKYVAEQVLISLEKGRDVE